MTPIEKAISDSRERESRVSPGHWVTNPKNSRMDCELWAVKKPGSRSPELIITHADGHTDQDVDNFFFFAASRTYEPRFRDALEVCVLTVDKLDEVLAQYAHVDAKAKLMHEQFEDLRKEIERILEGK